MKSVTVEFYVRDASDEMTLMCTVAGVVSVHDDVELDKMASKMGVSGWNYVVCGSAKMYRNRKEGKFVRADVILEFYKDKDSRSLGLKLVEGVEVDVTAVPRVVGYSYAAPSDGSGEEKEVVTGGDGGEVAPSASEGKLEDVKNEEVVEKKVEHGFTAEELGKMTKVELLELCMKHVDVKLWSENMKKAELISLLTV
jgi:hypothetical protein